MRLHVITNFEAHGGAETMLARLLRQSGDEAPVVVPLIGVSERNRRMTANDAVTVRPLGMSSPLALPSATLRLARMIRMYRPREVLCWMYHAMVMGQIAATLSRTRVPVFWTVRQALDDPTALTASTRAANALAARLSARSAGIIYNSDRARRQHEAFGYCGRNGAVIPNGFDLPPDRDVTMHAPKVFGIAARFHPQKDFATFFNAAAIAARANPDLRFVAAGDRLTDDDPEVRALIESSGLARDRIELRGQLDDMAAFYRAIDVLVLSSRTEGFPNVIAEAMSYGKPAVSTDAGDAAGIIADTGEVVPRQDPEALAAAILATAALSPEDYYKRGRAAGARIRQRYSLTAVCEAYERFLDAAPR